MGISLGSEGPAESSLCQDPEAGLCLLCWSVGLEPGWLGWSEEEMGGLAGVQWGSGEEMGGKAGTSPFHR